MKHKLSFELASQLFHDSTIMTEFDRTVNGEYRNQSIGFVGDVVLFVVHTEKDYNHEEAIHIISARKATDREQTAYVAKVGC